MGETPYGGVAPDNCVTTLARLKRHFEAALKREDVTVVGRKAPEVTPAACNEHPLRVFPKRSANCQRASKWRLGGAPERVWKHARSSLALLCDVLPGLFFGGEDTLLHQCFAPWAAFRHSRRQGRISPLVLENGSFQRANFFLCSLTGFLKLEIF